MDTTALRAAYEKLLDAAATPDLGDAADGGWNTDQILAHILSVDAGTAAAALAVVAGARPTFDNRISLDVTNIERIIAEHDDRAALIEHVRRQAGVLCDIGDQVNEKAASVLVPAFLMSNNVVVVDQPIRLAALIDGLAESHVPDHTTQILDLRVAVRT